MASLLFVDGFALAILLAVAGCPATPGAGGSAEDSPTGQELFTRITQDDPYQEWAQFPDREGTQPSVLPHGPMSRVFISREVESALTSFSGALPDGSIIVKENVGTSPDVTEAALTVMWKVQGFDPDNGDWFWANMTPEGEIVSEGRVAACAACHGGARENDFVFVHDF
ncbi:MAG: cytochrome P460 family protein [Phycisphaerae bacterium]